MTDATRAAASVQRWAYIGRTKKPMKHHQVAGTVVAAVVDDGERPDMVADALRDWINDDLIVERVPIEWVRLHLFTTEPYVPIAAMRSRAPGGGG